ncbi:tetratricopeptide repeat protein [Anaeroselena agilis]|uniref:Tetratricopeptide repeat protein n=1 Tax=Anaeroselena agilis TaxID=3063788 RepID=A0ABU3P030_9FIRM|nr:tetratricopeptide repeat protein [Selenomonadales bacterium 4137-cl]
MKNIPATIVIIAAVALLAGCGPQPAPANQPPAKPPVAGKAPALAADSAGAAEAEQHFAAGRDLYERYEYRAAVAEYDRAIAADPANYKVYTAKGIALCFEGDYKGGMALIRKTLDMRPGYVPALYDMAMAYKLQDDLDNSLHWFQQTLRGDPKNTWSYYGIATIHADRGETREALEYLRKAVDLDKGVKEVARRQEHFARMRALPEFQAIVR